MESRSAANRQESVDGEGMPTERDWLEGRVVELEAERDQLQRERDDFEQRLHAWMRGEHG